MNQYVWQSYGLNYTYNAHSVLTQIKDSQGRIWWSNPVYDHMGRIVSVKKGGVYQQRSYRLDDGTPASVSAGLTAGATSLQNHSYTFDDFGNLASKTDNYAGTRTETFGYDAVNRLIKQNNVDVVSYNNNEGNIAWRKQYTTSTAQAYTYSSAQPHAVATAFGYKMTYDANGRMATRENVAGGGVWSFAWTAFGQVSTIAKVEQCSQFAYGIGQNRIVHTKLDGWNTSTKTEHAKEKRLYAGGIEQFFENGAATTATPVWSAEKTRVYISGPDGMCGVYEHDPDGTTQATASRANLILTDYLGSTDSGVGLA